MVKIDLKEISLRQRINDRQEILDELLDKERTPERRKQIQLLRLMIWALEGELENLLKGE